MFHRPRQDAADNSTDKNKSGDKNAATEKSKDNQNISSQQSGQAYSPAAKASAPVNAGGNAIPGKTNSKPQQNTAQQKNTQQQNKEEKTMTEENKDNQNKSRPLDIPGQKSGYQPPAGSYGVGAYPGANNAASADTAGQGRRLIIGQGITMSGEIEACEYLVVEGTVEAALKGAKVLEITESGTFYGTVEIEEATIAGRFEGDITVSGRLTITASGSITGTVSYKELAVEAGATLDGKISPLAGKEESTSAPKKSKKEKSSGKDNAAARNDNKGDNSNDDESELPFSDTATAAAE